jgi:ABC-type lipoprotein export system ATPase subunit
MVCPSQTIAIVDVLDAEKSADYLMITRFQAHNFRCFENLTLEGLRRFNFILGESGSGKSALLEALFLLSGASPELHFRLRRWRGFAEGNLELQASRESFSSLFRFLFHMGDTEKVASLSLVDTDLGIRKLDIYFEDKETLSIPIERPENISQFVPITFKWDVGNRVVPITVELKDGKIKADGSVEVHPIHFISSRNLSSRYDAILFSTLSRSLRAQPLIETIHNIYPSIHDLSLEIVGGETLINAQVDGFKEKIPIGEVSGGLNKLVSIALAIAANPYGIVLIDEIENGFYYKNYREILETLAHFCEEYKVQMFASSHSREFLEAVADVMEERATDVMFIKTKYRDGKCEVTRLKGDPIISAILQDIEVRA